jgi:hypothetical protein
MASKSKEGLEIGDQVADQISKTLERANNWLALDNLRLAERYIEGRLRVLIEFSLEGQDYVASFQRAPELEHQEPASATGREVSAGRGKGRLGQTGDRCEQSMVLVGNIEFVENPEQVPFATLVRFDLINLFYSRRRRALYFSHPSGMVFRGSIEDRETGLLSRSVPIGNNKLVSEMIQGAPEVVNNIASNDANLNRRSLNPRHIDRCIASLRIALGSKSIGFSIEESLPGNFQFREMLFGPFGFYQDEGQSFVG